MKNKELAVVFLVFNFCFASCRIENDKNQPNGNERPMISQGSRYLPFTQIIDVNDTILFLFQKVCSGPNGYSWNFTARSHYLDSFVIVRFHKMDSYIDSGIKNYNENEDEFSYYQGYSMKVKRKDWNNTINDITKMIPEGIVADSSYLHAGCNYSIFLNGNYYLNSSKTDPFFEYVDSLLIHTVIKELYFNKNKPTLIEK